MGKGKTTNGIEKNDEKIKQEKSYSFEEAIGLCGSGRFHKLLLLVCGLCFLAFLTEIMGVGLVLELAKCEMNFYLHEQGILASAAFLGVLTSSHFFGFLTDTLGRSKTLKYSLVLSVITSIISIFSINVWMFVALRFFVGLFISGCQGVFSYLGEFHGTRTRARNITLLACSLPLGLVVLPLFAIIVLPLKLNLYLGSMKFSSWRFLILINSIPTLAGLIGAFCLPESPKYLIAQERIDEAIEVMKFCYRMNTNNDPSTYPVKNVYLDVVGANFKHVKNLLDALKLIWSQTIPLFNRQRIFNTLKIFFIMFNVFMISDGTFMWFPTILNAMAHYSESGYTVCEAIRQFGWNETPTEDVDPEDVCEAKIHKFVYEILMTMGVAYTLLYLLLGWVIVYTGKRRLIIIILIVAGIESILLCWTNIFYLNLALLTLTVGVSNCIGIINSVAIEYYPTNISAMGICLIMMIGRIGAIFGSNVIGLILHSNCELLYIMYVFIILLMIPLAYFLPGGKL